MSYRNIDDSPLGGWNWTALCGEEGLKIWSSQRHDMGLCFQQLFLQIPVLSFLACVSAYYYGRREGFVTRSAVQLMTINIRCIITLLMALLPLLHVYIFVNKTEEAMNQITYLSSAVNGIAWFTHFIYNIALRKRLGKSPRGPTLVCAIWSLLLVLTIIFVQSNYSLYKYSFKPSYSIYLGFGFSICYTILQFAYALTLVPGVGNSTYLILASRGTESSNETQPLLSNAYNGFIEEGDPSYLGVAMEDANWFSKLLFYWVNPLMEKGAKEGLNNTDDLYDLPMSLNCANVSSKLERALKGKSNRQLRHPVFDDPASISTSSSVSTVSANAENQKVSLLRALHQCFAVQFYSVGILKLIADCAGFAGPMLLNKLVYFIEHKSEDIKFGYIYAGGLLLTTLISALCDCHFNFLMTMVGLKMRASLVTTIYRKTLSVSGTMLNSQFSVGEIVNFMSTDTDRIVNACPSFHAVWSIPFQLGVTLYLLYDQVGLSFLAGLIFSIILIPINKVIANKIGRLSTKLMEQKDSRVKIITEVLRGIKAIKLYVWEQHFIRQITKLRDKELKYLKGRKYLDALCVYFWATTPVVISILTFATYVLSGNKLTAATVFTSIALLNMLISPLNAFPWVLNGMTEAWVSIKRIQKLLDLPDLDFNDFYNQTILTDDNIDILLRDANFSWLKKLSHEEKKSLHSTSHIKSLKGKGKGKKSTLKQYRARPIEQLPEEDDSYVFKSSNLNLSVKKGEFIGVIGSIGSGKSSLLASILAELSLESGDIAVKHTESGFGLVTQQPWLQRGTLRDNILFGKPYEDAKYKSVLYACGLMEDINTLPAADMTGVGEGGMTLSGGQKARVALARAVYQDKPIYLLDDILSAVDVKVAKHIFQNCITGLLKHKTRILCTHHIQYLAYADRIITMENGTFAKIGKPADILSNADAAFAIDIELGDSIASSSTSASNSLLDSIKNEIKTNSSEERDSILLQEHSESGSVELSVYMSYWKAIGHLLSFSILIAVVLMQTSRNMTDLWLAHWVTNSESGGSNSTNISSYLEHDVLFMAEDFYGATIDSYLKIYVAFAVINTVFTLFRAFLFAYGGIVAAGYFHKHLLKVMMRAKSTFFDITPIGRILNRFSSDTYTIDDSLPFILNILLAQFFGLIGCVAVTVYGLPWICLVLVPLIPVYNWLQNHYRLTSRELKRISSVTLSPVYNHFNESLQGLITIRAMRATQRFKRDNEDNVESNLKAQFASQAAARWLGLRLQFIGVAVVGGVSFIAVIQHQYDVVDPGLIGLAISYALSVTGALSGVVNAFTETEREMIAVERVNQYINEIPLESTHFVTDPPFGWPSQGVISFSSVVLKYREHLTPALNDVTFETRPAEKIGVVGRTGAGKSSLISALFRLVEIASGTICIDSINVGRISIAALRSRLFCIPQDPFLFSGTIRENLDPLCEFRDNEIWNALNKVNLGGMIKNLGGLNNTVDGAGVNFSAGQKQLVCLARAVLHNAKILCIDEATANVDHETDRQIQQTLRTAFRKSTVITIAHRVQTVLDSDRVLVMNEGRVVEFDNPDDLLSDSTSYFYQLVNNE